MNILISSTKPEAKEPIVEGDADIQGQSHDAETMHGLIDTAAETMHGLIGTATE